MYCLITLKKQYSCINLHVSLFRIDRILLSLSNKMSDLHGNIDCSKNVLIHFCSILGSKSVILE